MQMRKNLFQNTRLRSENSTMLSFFSVLDAYSKKQLHRRRLPTLSHPDGPQGREGWVVPGHATLRSAGRGGSIPQCHCEVPFFTVDGSLQGALRVLNCWVSNVFRRNDRVFPRFCQQLVGILSHRGLGKPPVQNIGSKPDRSWSGVRMKRSDFPFSNVMSFMQSFQKLL